MHRITLVLLLSCLVASGAFAQTSPFNRTVIVNSTGNQTADGAALLSALSGLTPPPSSADRWVIQLEGGVYDVGSTQVLLSHFIDLVGVGSKTTFIQGNYPGGNNYQGLVQGASDSEIRDLTIKCVSTTASVSCRSVGLDGADARLTDMRILSRGTGGGSHWGIRAFDSQPVLDRVEILADSSNADNNYGIVLAGESKLDIRRSNIVAQNAALNNWGVFVDDDPLDGGIRDTTIYTAGGNDISAGVYMRVFGSEPTLEFENVTVTAHGSNVGVGIGVEAAFGLPELSIIIRHGSVYGTTRGVDHGRAFVDLVNSEVYGSVIRVHGNHTRVGGSWLRGSGTISGVTSVVCAGNFNAAYAFYASTCPP